MSSKTSASDSEDNAESITLRMSSPDTVNDKEDNEDMENLCAIRDYLRSPIFQSRRKSSRKLHGSYNRLYCEPPDPMTANEIFSILSEENNECIMRNFVSEDESNSICDPCSVILEDPLEITEEGNGELQHSPVQVLNNKQYLTAKEQNEKQTKNSRVSAFQTAFENSIATQNIVVISLSNHSSQNSDGEQFPNTNITLNDNPENNSESNKIQRSNLCDAPTNSISIPSACEFSSEENEDYFYSFRYSRKRVLIISSSSECEDSEESLPNTSIKPIKRNKTSGNTSNLNYCFETDCESILSENDTVFMKTSRHSKDPNYTVSYGNFSLQRRAKVRTMNRLKKYLEEIGISLNRYKDFWNDCKKNAQKMTRFIKRLLNKLDSCNITCEPAAIKKELEVYQESLILDKELVISYNERVTRSKTQAAKILMQQKILNSYKELRSKKIRTLQIVLPTSKRSSLEYATLYSSISSVVDE